MIIIGYQGIGKSTLARENLKEHGMSEYIDLESSCFWHDGQRPDDWYIYYCQMAEYLSREGFCVFISSHEVVRNWLRNSKENVFIICPSLELKEGWIKKLEERYINDPTDKNYKAWKNAENRYEENIKELLSDNFFTFLIDNLEYDLVGIIDHVNSIRRDLDILTVCRGCNSQSYYSGFDAGYELGKKDAQEHIKKLEEKIEMLKCQDEE